MHKRPDPWHVPRAALADSILNVISSRVSNVLLLFAPRRRGKTDFLLKDLAPRAKELGRQTIYVDFWKPGIAPINLLIRAIEETCPPSLLTQARNVAASLLTRVSVSGELSTPGAKISAELAPDERPSSDMVPHAYLESLLDALAGSGRPTTLLLDEFQEIARAQDGAAFIAMLRAQLKHHEDRVSTVITGSSMAALRAIFDNRDAPFFRTGTMIEFPDHGRDFVRHMGHALTEQTGRKLDEDAADRVFESVGRNPQIFRSAMAVMVMDKSLTLNDSVAIATGRLARDENLDDRWGRLGLLDRCVLTHILQQPEIRPYSGKARAQLAEAAGLGQVSASRVQSSLKRLERNGFVSTWSGGPSVDDPLIRLWAERHK